MCFIYHFMLHNVPWCKTCYLLFFTKKKLEKTNVHNFCIIFIYVQLEYRLLIFLVSLRTRLTTTMTSMACEIPFKS